VDSVAAEVVAAGAALHVPVDAATARLVVAANTRQRLNELLDINAAKFDFKCVYACAADWLAGVLTYLTGERPPFRVVSGVRRRPVETRSTNRSVRASPTGAVILRLTLCAIRG
jgi:hypothetical protein